MMCGPRANEPQRRIISINGARGSLPIVRMRPRELANQLEPRPLVRRGATATIRHTNPMPFALARTVRRRLGAECKPRHKVLGFIDVIYKTSLDQCRARTAPEQE